MRESYIDYIKSFAILLVVLFHCKVFIDNPVVPVFYSICVPLFFAVNGYLMLKKERSLQSLVNTNIKIIFLVIVYDVLYVLWTEYLNNEPIKSVETIKHIKSFSLNYSHRLWFLNALFFLNCFNPFIYKIIQEKRLTYALLVLLLCFAPSYSKIFWCFDIMGHTYSFSLVYYVLGYVFLANYTTIRHFPLTRKNIITVLCCSFIIEVIVNYFCVNYFSNSYPTYFNCVTSHSIAIIVATISFCMLIQKLSLRSNKFITFISSNTLGIYILHTFPQYWLKPYHLHALVEFILTLSITLLLVYIFNLNKYTKWLISHKLKI